ncbi:Peptidase S8/S53 domain containing protein [Rhypophila sp. PSN 637]
MSSSLTINGRKVALGHDLDSSNTNYILIRTTGDPLNKRQKSMLEKLGVTINEFVGDGDEQVYLCGYPKDSLVQIDKLDFINYVGPYANEFVLPRAVIAGAEAQAKQVISVARVRPKSEAIAEVTVDIHILLQHDITELTSELLHKIAQAADVSPSKVIVEDGAVHVEVHADKLDRISALDEVRVLHVANEASLFNNIARKILNVGPSESLSTGSTGVKQKYRGGGQIVCVADTGFDKGSLSDTHNAFAGRVKALYAWGRQNTGVVDDIEGHGTHVCGSVLGSGRHSSQGLIEGTAPDAELIVQSLFSRWHPFSSTKPVLGGIPKTSLGRLFSQAYDDGARIHTNSWGTGLPQATKIQPPYDGRSESIDQFVWDHQDMTILFAAGNDGQDAALDGKLDGRVNERSLGAEAASKNCITVGATENHRPDLMAAEADRPYTYGSFFPEQHPVNPLRDDHMANNPEGLAAFSSRGPTAEDRLKPDVVAPGTAILSARSRKMRYVSLADKGGKSEDPGYMYLAGTSMATPLVAGICALIREALLANGWTDEQPDGTKNPTGSLVKALLINGAVSIKGQYMPDDIWHQPNPHSGFGRVDLAGSLPKLNDPFSGYDTGVADEDNEEPVHVEISIPVVDPAKSLTFKITLAYADLPGGQLQNDLNLLVVIGGEQRHGNQGMDSFPLGTKTVGFDRRNNVEQVLWENIPASAHDAGSFVKVVVKPFRFMSSKVPFSYAWRFL